MATSAGSRISAPPFLEDEKEHRRLLTQWAQQAHLGHLANVGEFTLASGATSLSVVDTRAGASSFIIFTPMNAAAGTEFGAGGIWIQGRGKQVFTIKCTGAASSRTFMYALLG